MLDLFALDALLLAICSLPVVLKYRILPVDGTPYGLFGILFVLLLANLVISLCPRILGSKEMVLKIKSVVLLAVIAIVVLGSSVTAIVDRSHAAPVYGVHDIILQQEAAMRYLLSGKNPYKETYFGTPMESWHYAELGRDAINPALYHFVMPPWYLLFPFFFYFLMLPAVGFFDGRIVLLFTLAGTIIILMRWFKRRQLGLVSVILLSVSPGLIDYFMEGRSDTFALFWLLWSVYLLDKRRLLSSSIMFGLALMSKQTIWFAAPFYAAMVWVTQKKSPAKTALALLPAAAVSLLVAGPFILWDPKAFFDSVILYLSGGTSGGYPVSGYGLGMLLYGAGGIRDIHAYYPFAVWQLVFGLPVMAAALWFFIRKPTVSKFFIGYAITLSVVWYMSRYFNNSHLIYIASLFTLGVLKQWDESETHEK